MGKMEKTGFKSLCIWLISIIFVSDLSAQTACDQYVNKLQELTNYRKQSSIDNKVLKSKAGAVLQYMEPCFDSRPATEPGKQVERYYLLGRVYYDAYKLTEASYFLKKCRDHQYANKYTSGNKTYRELSAALYSATAYAQTSANRTASGSLSYSGKGGYVRTITETFDADQGEPFNSIEIEDFAERQIKIYALEEGDIEAIKARAGSSAVTILDPFIIVNDVSEEEEDMGGQRKVEIGLEPVEEMGGQKEVDFGLELDEDMEGFSVESAAQGFGEGLVRFYQFLRDNYGIQAPSEYMTIYLDHSAFSKEGYSAFSAFAKRIHFRNAGGRVAYYNPMDQSVVCWISTGTGTLNHEVVHALVRQDYPDIPGWFDEGFGAMFEETYGNYEPLDNYRLIYLKEAMKQNIFPDIRTLVAAPDSKFDADKETMLYAAAGRYLMMYLHEKGLLASLYQNMRYEPGASRETQLEMLLNITGMDEWSFNNAWKNWISGRSVPEKWVSQQAEVEAYITSLAKS